MGLGFGDFAAQLNADELARAYASAGGRPDELQIGAPPQAQPAPAPVQLSPAAPAQDMTLQAPRGAPGRNVQRMDQDQLADANARIALAGNSGEQQAQAFEQRAGVRREEAMRAREGVEGARADVAKRREHEDRYQAEADRLYDDMRAHATPPPPSKMEQVMGIVAAVAAMGGKSGAAQGAKMLAGAFGNDPGRWEAEQQANSALFHNALGMIGSDRSGATHDLEVAQRMTALEGNEAEIALGQIAETSKSAEMRAAARDTQLQLRMQTRAGLRAMEEAKSKAAGGKQRSAVEDYFWKVPYGELRAMPSQIMGEVGQRVLAERTKIEQGQQNLDGKPGEAGVQAGQTVPGGRKVVDPGIYNLAEKATLAKLVDGEGKAQSAIRNIGELEKLVAAHGTENWPGEVKRRMQFLEKQIKLDLKDAGELGTWDKGSAEVLGDMIGDPTAWNMGLGNVVEGVGVKLAEAKKMIQYKTEQRAKSLGLQYDPVATGEKEAPKGYTFKPRPAAPQHAARDFIESREGAGRGGI